MIRQSVRAFEQAVITAVAGQPVGQPFPALPGTPPDPSRHSNRRQTPYPAWSEGPLICMACKRPGVRVPLAPRFHRSKARCDLQKRSLSACNSASCQKLEFLFRPETDAGQEGATQLANGCVAAFVLGQPN